MDFPAPGGAVTTRFQGAVDGVGYLECRKMPCLLFDSIVIHTAKIHIFLIDTAKIRIIFVIHKFSGLLLFHSVPFSEGKVAD